MITYENPLIAPNGTALWMVPLRRRWLYVIYKPGLYSIREKSQKEAFRAWRFWAKR